MDNLSGKDVENMLINPFYAITISDDLMGAHEPLVSQEQWLTANTKLIDDIGAEAWLEKLLAVLQGDFPRSPSEAQAANAIRRRATATAQSRLLILYFCEPINRRATHLDSCLMYAMLVKLDSIRRGYDHSS